MPLIAPMTELEAVNRMLASIGQSPVNTVEVSGIADVSAALSELRSITRDLQTVGTVWNTDENYELSPTVDSYILVPDNVLDIDPMDPEQDIVESYREGTRQLWDRANLTWLFAEPVSCRIMWAKPFAEMPQAFRTYAATKAARRFQANRISSPVLERFNESDELSAFILFQRRERASRDTNLFRNNPRLRRFTRRTSL